MAHYLDKVKNVEHRGVLTKLRTGYDCLSLVKGRQTNVDRQERLCPLCKEVEDAKHFHFHCENMAEARSFLLASLRKLHAEFHQRPVKTSLDAILNVKFTAEATTEKNRAKCSQTIHSSRKNGKGCFMSGSEKKFFIFFCNLFLVFRIFDSPSWVNF